MAGPEVAPAPDDLIDGIAVQRMGRSPETGLWRYRLCVRYDDRGGETAYYVGPPIEASSGLDAYMKFYRWMLTETAPKFERCWSGTPSALVPAFRVFRFGDCGGQA